MQLETPIVFLIFNRPETTAKVFERIRQSQPKQLLVVADGPRQNHPQDAEQCATCRAIIDQVDWDCQVLTNFSDVNLGCKKRISSGLNWAFEQVEAAIILEDDCLPHPTFFQFCQELLRKYHDDERIMVISGDNFQLGQQRTEDSYYFSRYTHIWGWATWRRAWQHYDIEMRSWETIRDQKWLYGLLKDQQAARYWTGIFQKVYQGKIDSWAYGWTFACWIQNGLTILPRVNLVTNIGFSSTATHTRYTGNRFANLPSEAMLFPLKHPPFMMRHAKADDYTQSTMFNLNLYKIMSRVLGKIFALLKRS